VHQLPGRTLNPKPSTLNPKHYILNPQPWASCGDLTLCSLSTTEEDAANVHGYTGAMVTTSEVEQQWERRVGPCWQVEVGHYVATKAQAPRAPPKPKAPRAPPKAGAYIRPLFGST